MKEQYRPKHTKKQKVRLPLSAYLSYLLIATLLFTGVSFSKFASSGSAGDGARVAVVVVNGGSDDTETNLSLGDGVTDAIYSFYLTNIDEYGQISEVSLDYTVSVTMPNYQSLPEGVEMSLAYAYDVDNGEGSLATTTSKCTPIPYANDGVYTFEGGADFAAGIEAQHKYILTFTVLDESLITVDYDFTGIEISVKAEQID